MSRSVSGPSRLPSVTWKSPSPTCIGGSTLQYVVIEKFRGGDPVPVYRRFKDKGRLAPDGLRYVASWVARDLAVCYQIMECDDRRLLDAWMANWHDIVDFEVIPAMTSAEALSAVEPRL